MARSLYLNKKLQGDTGQILYIALPHEGKAPGGQIARSRMGFFVFECLQIYKQKKDNPIARSRAVLLLYSVYPFLSNKITGKSLHCSWPSPMNCGRLTRAPANW